MKNNIWFIASCLLFFFAGYSLNNVAVSFPKYKVAVVDVTQIMEKSSAVKSLKTSQDKQMKELDTLISKAQNEIVNAPSPEKAQQLEATYRKQIETKKNSIDEEYSKKIVEITTNIKNEIASQAKKSDYNLVLPTGMVISGGEDITQNILTQIK